MSFNFNGSKCDARFRISSLKNEKEIQAITSELDMIYTVEITLPNLMHIPETITDVLHPSNYEYYIAHQVPVIQLVDTDFIGAFVKNGSFFGLSLGTRVDVDDCMAILPSGNLILSLTKDTYEELGLQGRPSQFKNEAGRKFVVEINLVADSFYPGKANYDRVHRVFQSRTEMKFDLLLNWEPHDQDISNRSIYQFMLTQGCQVDICALKNEGKCHYSLPVPDISWHHWQEDDASCGFEALIDWLGALHNDVDMTNEVNEFISSFTCPTPNTVIGQVAHQRWNGFITSSIISKILECLCSMMQSVENLSWAVLVAHGFDDVPKTKRNRDHGYSGANGDNLYCVVLFPEDHYWLYTNTVVGTNT